MRRHIYPKGDRKMARCWRKTYRRGVTRDSLRPGMQGQREAECQIAGDRVGVNDTISNTHNVKTKVLLWRPMTRM
jgi:hypothetical protein